MTLASIGCGTTGSSFGAGTVVLAQEAPGVAVSGRGAVMASPDVAVVTLGVEATGATVAEARETAAQAAQALQQTLATNRIEKKDIQTSQLSIQPQYQYGPDGQNKLLGYTVTNMVTVKVRDLSALGRTLDEAVVAARNNARVHGIQFEIDDPAPLRDQARDKAVAEARKKAEQLAKLAGVELGAPIAIEEIGYSAPQFPGHFYAAKAELSATPVEPGQSEVAVEVRVRWAID